MPDSEKSEIAILRTRLAEAEAALAALCDGSADALVTSNGVIGLTGAEKPYQTFFSAMNEGGLTLDADGHILHCNPRLSSMLGRDLETIRGCCFSEYITHRDSALFNDLLSQDGAGSCETTLIAQDQTALPVRLSLRPMYIDAQRLICLVVTDLTERLRAEDNIRQKEAKMRGIFLAAPVGIGLVVQGLLTEVNQKLCDMTGFHVDELLGQSSRLLYPSDEIFEYVNREKYNQIAAQGVGTIETHFKHKCESRFSFKRLSEIISEIRVVVVGFKHDLADESEEGMDAEALARAMLIGCIGGLDQVFAAIDWRLPMDAEQAHKPRDHWEKSIPLRFVFSPNEVKFGTSRSRPHLQLRVELCAPETPDDTKGSEPMVQPFQWSFGPTHPERVRYQCAQAVLERWHTMASGPWVLPAFLYPSDVMTALYFASDADEANRLVVQAISDMELLNLLDDLPTDNVDESLRDLVGDLGSRYQTWLRCSVEQGHYAANAAYFHGLSNAYQNLAKAVLDTRRIGSPEVLRRLYKAFLLLDKTKTQPNSDFLHSAAAWGISLHVLELTHARTGFLRDGFAEAASAYLLDRASHGVLDRLLTMVEIHRPIAGLVVDAHKKLSAEIRSFGLIHYLGQKPPVEKSLAIQTLLREEENDDDEEVKDYVRETKESRIVQEVLDEYVRFYPFAQDGLRIVTVHVDDLATVLAGVGRFLREYLKSNPRWPAFHCTLMVYSTASSPMVMENRLVAWREAFVGECGEVRPLRLTVGHRYAPKQEDTRKLLREEERRYDLAFLFHSRITWSEA